ncbi:MAG: DUF3857 domain-containing transglutaminase family protein [Gemmatimonadales bacterium]
MIRLLPVGLIVAAAVSPQDPQATLAERLRADTDTIYSLAVDSTDYPGHDIVYLLDDGIVELVADGRALETYHVVVQIQTQDGAALFGEQSHTWLEGRQEFRVNWVRVVTPEGELISDGPQQQQETSTPVSQLIPIYTDLKMLRFSVAGLAPGTLLDFSYTQETIDPVMPSNFSSAWSVTTGAPTLRSRLVLDVPATLEPHISETNLDFTRAEYERDGRRTYVWATSDVETLDPEPFTTWPDNGHMGVYVSGAVEWAEIGRWYADLARDRYQLTPEIETRLSEIVGDAATLRDSIRAAHRWVAQEIRFVSLALGMGGYQPRPPAQVFESRAGDCKDKSTLFISLLRQLGVEAYPVLLNQGAVADSLVPSLSEFDHVIVAVQSDEGRVFTDLTAELLPYGVVPGHLEGGFALLVHPDGGSEQIRIPRSAPEMNRWKYRIAGVLSEDGSFTGSHVQKGSGMFGFILRSALVGFDRSNERYRAQLARAIANELFAGASGSELEVFDPHDLAVEARIKVSVAAPSVLTRVGSNYILSLPIPLAGEPGSVSELEERIPREHPIDVGQVVGPQESSWTFELTLPDGWQADLPEGTKVISRFGQYAAEYVQEGRVLRVVRRVAGRDGVVPADVYGELIAWYRALAEDDVQFIVLTPGGEGG